MLTFVILATLSSAASHPDDLMDRLRLEADAGVPNPWADDELQRWHRGALLHVLAEGMADAELVTVDCSEDPCIALVAASQPGLELGPLQEAARARGFETYKPRTVAPVHTWTRAGWTTVVPFAFLGAPVDMGRVEYRLRALPGGLQSFGR
jgi:hypothetical protein